MSLVSSLTALTALAFLSAGLPSLTAADAHPVDTSALSLETGLLGEVRHNTPFNYRLIPTQLSWRSATFLSHTFADGSRFAVRHRLTLLATIVRNGPESHYLAFDGSPSFEYWNPKATRALYAGVGGGFGWIDSRGIAGGQGQDLTLNWFARAGVEQKISETGGVLIGVMFNHMSNLGMTNPNPGIDALGLTFGGSWRF